MPLAAEGERRPNTQSPKSLRWSARRALNHVDPDGASIANDLYASTDIPDTEAGAAFDAALLVHGYDEITLQLDHTAGTTTTAVHVVTQVSYQPAEGSDQWFDLYDDELGDGVLVRKIWDVTTAVDANVAWTIKTHGVRMRFKVWVDGADNSDSRARLLATRIMRSV
jgi:hypothetical protein